MGKKEKDKRRRDSLDDLVERIRGLQQSNPSDKEYHNGMNWLVGLHLVRSDQTWGTTAEYVRTWRDQLHAGEDLPSYIVELLLDRYAAAADIALSDSNARNNKIAKALYLGGRQSKESHHRALVFEIFKLQYNMCRHKKKGSLDCAIQKVRDLYDVTYSNEYMYDLIKKYAARELEELIWREKNSHVRTYYKRQLKAYK